MEGLQLVLKLKKKLNDAVEQERGEDYVLRVLQRLSQVPMTLSILQNTQIGRDVNGLRKLSGNVRTESKALVQSWKKLLPPVESDKSSQDSCSSSASGHSNRRSHAHSSSIQGMAIRDTGSSHVDTKSHKTASKSRNKSKVGTGRKPHSKVDAFSQALLGAADSQSSQDAMDCFESEFPSILDRTPHVSITSTHRIHKSKKHKEVDSRTELKKPNAKHQTLSPSPVSSNHDRYGNSDSATSSSLNHGNPGLSLSGDQTTSKESPQVDSRKRKADVVGTLDAVALSKRSRTQVYSGKKTVSGPQFVTPLFDLCIKVLIDNIDVIEEVGGVPFYVLEPVLSRCTPTQLMRLEEYNPHFVEDSDGLWEKHCHKEFKGALPIDDQTWRELYIDKLEDRELKLKNLTARISATEKARQEPVRKVISTVATRQPGRRGARSVPFFPGKSGGPGRPMERSSRARPLMKQTMKMAKERKHMMRFKPGQR